MKLIAIKSFTLQQKGNVQFNKKPKLNKVPHLVKTTIKRIDFQFCYK